MLAGQFIRGDGLILPNNITLRGAQFILEAAFKNVWTDVALALVQATPGPDLDTIIEPTDAVNGYGRQALTRDANGWPVVGLVNGVQYIESKFVTFTAVGGPFNQAIQRVMLVATGISRISLSSALPAPIIIDPTTPLDQRQFKYRLYLR